ncbi:hypothetical protein DPMN_085973 [Dreissena polymorpha]|uniref:Uncharacterized protein n=1 Tax=Dreissena polymorpha TaxID=45954 RepID=A0A9D4BKS5_DREPO|nr:hypothetical protein DPMN_085973 [Dreissena polymorpha]
MVSAKEGLDDSSVVKKYFAQHRRSTDTDAPFVVLKSRITGINRLRKKPPSLKTA